jgi:hypothetical protein
MSKIIAMTSPIKPERHGQHGERSFRTQQEHVARGLGEGAAERRNPEGRREDGQRNQRHGEGNPEEHVVRRQEHRRDRRRGREGLRRGQVQHGRKGQAELPGQKPEHDRECVGGANHAPGPREVVRKNEDGGHPDRGVDHAEDVAAGRSQKRHPRDPGIAESEDRKPHHDEDLVESLEEFERFVEALEMGAHARAFLCQDNEGRGLRLAQRAGGNRGTHIVTGDGGHAPMRSTVRLPLV